MSSYLAEDAHLIRTLLPPEAHPPGDDDALFVSYAVLMRAKRTGVTTEDVHDAWAAWMLGRDPQHPAIVPFAELSPAAQGMDVPYAQAIRAAAHQRAAGG